MTPLRMPHQFRHLFGNIFRGFFPVSFGFFLAACATTDVPQPLIGEVKTQTANVGVLEPCVDLAKVPARPASHAAPVGADPERIARGLRADARDLRQYAAELEAEIVRCSKLPPNKPEGK